MDNSYKRIVRLEVKTDKHEQKLLVSIRLVQFLLLYWYTVMFAFSDSRSATGFNVHGEYPYVKTQVFTAMSLRLKLVCRFLKPITPHQNEGFPISR